MFYYKFPIIENISQVLPAIQDRPEFIVAERDGYTIINYNVAFDDTFPPVISKFLDAGHEQDYYAALRRECRGIIFDSNTGQVIRRPYHKFKNFNESEETQAKNIDISEPHSILTKADGSMIAPFLLDGKIIWATKMAAPDFHETVSNFVKNSAIHYETFAKRLINYGFTPIFEWCSRKNRIVLDYPEDMLVLTAIRNIRSGEYVNYDAMIEFCRELRIPVIDASGDLGDIEKFSKYVRDLKNQEGFVVRFENGHMIKFKAHEYVQIHKAKEKILQDRNIVELILDNKLDDIKAHLPKEDQIRLDRFETVLGNHIFAIAKNIHSNVCGYHALNLTRKEFAVDYADTVRPFYKSIIFKLWDCNSVEKAYDEVLNVVRNNLGSNVKYNALRDVWFNGEKYND